MVVKIKATGEIVHVTYIGNGKYVTDRPNDYHRYDYEEIEELPDDYDCVQYNSDYWTRLEHQYAGMAMQGILSNNELYREICKSRNLEITIMEYAHALVKKVRYEENPKELEGLKKELEALKIEKTILENKIKLLKEERK